MRVFVRVTTALMLLSGAGAGVLGAQSYVPQRVFDSARGGFTDFESMLADLATADVLFVGEQHDDPNTHRLELAVLEGLARRRGDIVLSLEMFERDVQRSVDRFAAGQIGEEAFLSFSRPWPRYRTDYKPLVDFAIARRWPIVAANVPRPLASEVSKAGWSALEARTASERPWFAADRDCPTGGEYYDRFVRAMSSHPQALSDEQARLYYFAQCLKDETMGESIARAFAGAADGDRRPLVVHVNGAFHSDFGLGAAARARRRLSDERLVVVTMIPVADLDAITPDDEARRRADYLVYTTR